MTSLILDNIFSCIHPDCQINCKFSGSKMYIDGRMLVHTKIRSLQQED